MWPATFRGSRDKQAPVRAIACVDSALWDLMGKAAGLPLYHSLGRRARRLPIIAIGGQYGENFTAADYGREMEELPRARARRLQVQGRRQDPAPRMPSAPAAARGRGRR